MTIVGGLRDRLVRDSVWHVLDDGMRALGWYTSLPSRSPVALLARPVDSDVEVPINSLAMGDTVIQGTPAEMGSGLTEVRWDMHVDFYGENDAVALHVIGDVAAIMAGQLASIGRTAPVVAVWDYTLATPAAAFVVEIENIQTAKASGFTQPWLRFWRSCSFVVVDTYDGGTDEDTDMGFGGY